MCHSFKWLVGNSANLYAISASKLIEGPLIEVLLYLSLELSQILDVSFHGPKWFKKIPNNFGRRVPLNS
jgi:hypothetical protein